jgi:hypothetical protein
MPHTGLMLLSTMFVPLAFASGQVKQSGGETATPPSASTIAAKAKSAKLDTKHAKSASINGKKFNLIPADLSGITSRDQLAAGTLIGVLDNEAGAAEDVSLPPGRFNIYLEQSGGQWQTWAEHNGKVYKAKRNFERKDLALGTEPQFSRGSGCWVFYIVFWFWQWCY